MKNILDSISKNITELDSKINLVTFIEKYNKINLDIKSVDSQIEILKKKFEDTTTLQLSQPQNELTEEQYLDYLKDISENEIHKIINCEDIDSQVDQYKNLLHKINLCKKYIELKKMKIIECDNIIDNIIDKQAAPIILKCKTKTKKCKKKQSSDLDSN